MHYLVSWEIDIEANSAKEAAEKALAIHRDPQSIATVFKVQRHDSGEASLLIDLSEQEAR